MVQTSRITSVIQHFFVHRILHFKVFAIKRFSIIIDGKTATKNHDNFVNDQKININLKNEDLNILTKIMAKNH